MLTSSEQRVLLTFRQFLMTPGEMLCFSGPNLARNTAALRQLTDKEMLVKEGFEGGYSLTDAGYRAMKACHSGALAGEPEAVDE